MWVRVALYHRSILPLGYVSGVNSFYAALYTDAGGLPGTLLGRWDNLSSTTNFGSAAV